MGLDSVAFPEQVRAYFQEHPTETDDENTQLIKIFQENVGAKEEFINWAKAHPSLVERTPRLYHTLELIDSTGWQATAARIKQSFWIPADSSLELINQVLAHKDNQIARVRDIPAQYASTALELFETGVINKDQVVKLFSIKDEKGNIPFSYSNVFNAAIPFLETMDSHVLKALLSIIDQKGNTVLHRVPSSIPLLQKLDTNDQVELLSIKNEQGMVPLHYSSVFELVIPFLKTLDSHVLESLFSIKDELGYAVLHFNEAAIPFLETMDSHVLKALLSIKTEIGNTVLHAHPKSILLLKKLDTNDQVELLSIKNKRGFNFFHNTSNSNHTIFEAAIPFLKTLDSDVLKALLSKKNQNGDTFLHRVPASILLLQKLDTNDQVELLSIKNKQGLIAFQDSMVFQAAIPFLETLDSHVLKALLSIKNQNGDTVLRLVPSSIPLLHKMDTNDQVELLSIKNEQGATPLHLSDVFQDAIPFLEKLDSHVLKALLSIKNKHGSAVLHHVPSSIPLLHKMDTNDQVELLSIKDKQGNTPLHYYVSKAIIPFLETLDSHVLKALLSIKNTNGITVLHITPSSIPLLKKMDTNDQVELLSIKNEQGDTPLHHPDIFKEAMPVLVLMSDEQLDQLFSIENLKGKTILDNPKNLKEVRLLLNRNIPSLQKYKCQLSENWLVKDKISTDLKALSEEDYQEKAAKLKEEVDTLWNSFVFGGEEGDIPAEYLNIRISSENKTFTPEEIKEKLDVMIGKIINKEAWLGTPPATDKPALHLFYTQMLTNFEQLLTSLANEESPEKKAGPLISIAKTELEGRCAAAYQSEIEQAKMLQVSDTEEVGLEANFNKLARASLSESIERIVRRDYGGNSHAFSQMLFSVGLASSADPLTPVSVDVCQEEIKADWTKDKLVSSLTEMIGRLEREQLQHWFFIHTPDDYGPELRVKQAEIQKAEQAIIQETKELLKKEDLYDPLIDKVQEIIQSTQGLGLRISSPQRKNVSEAVFNQMNQATTLEEVKAAHELFKEENKALSDKKFELLDEKDALKVRPKESLSEEEKKRLENLDGEIKILQLKGLEIGKEFNALKLNAETRIKFEDLIRKEYKKPISQIEMESIIAAKIAFEGKIRAMAEEKVVDYHPSETGLPSNNLEFQRKADYASQFFSEKEDILKLNKRGTEVILLNIGVLENVA